MSFALNYKNVCYRKPGYTSRTIRQLKDMYGDKINFFGDIDQQALLPDGDIAAIQTEMARRAAILGAGGGYLMAPAHIIQADVSPDTVRVITEFARKGYIL